MKKAVISTGGKQYLVAEGDEVDVERVGDTKKLEFEPLMVIEDGEVSIGSPAVSGKKVQAEVIERTVLADKVVAIRYKAKKRVRKVRGHRQTHSRIKITQIT